MAVRKGIIANTPPFATARRPSFRAARPTVEGSVFDLLEGADGQPFSINVDTAIRVIRPIVTVFDVSVRISRQYVLLADLRQSTGSRVSLLADTRFRISGVTAIHAEALLRIGRRVTRLADLSQCIGVGADLSADIALTIYRVILHEDHLIHI